MENLIEARGLTRRFARLVAVDHVDFDVRRGEIFGFLGPNGAGKTTTVRMLTGCILPNEGSASVDGHDIIREPVAAREHLSIVPEEGNVYVNLTVWQNVMLMGELYGVARARRRQRGEQLLKLFGLNDKAAQKGRTLSKGLRQRLMLCMALVSDPTILFLDEPTSGLDVASARLIRELIVQMNRDDGMTVFLTTHNIDEAERLCDRVAIIHNGRIAAIDAPGALRNQFESVRSVEVTFSDPGLDEAELRAVPGVNEVRALAGGFRLFTSQPGRAAEAIGCLARERGAPIESIRTLEPSLEEVFVRITETPEETTGE